MLNDTENYKLHHEQALPLQASETHLPTGRKVLPTHTRWDMTSRNPPKHYDFIQGILDEKCEKKTD